MEAGLLLFGIRGPFQRWAVSRVWTDPRAVALLLAADAVAAVVNERAARARTRPASDLFPAAGNHAISQELLQEFQRGPRELCLNVAEQASVPQGDAQTFPKSRESQLHSLLFIDAGKSDGWKVHVG